MGNSQVNKTIGSRLLYNLPLLCSVFFIAAYYNFLQFLSPALYDPDSYYHIAVARFIRDYGPHYQFHWAQFSTFKEFFSDKDFLFHVLLIPFLYLSKNIILSAKLAAVFLNVLFLSAYAFILRKYVKPFFAACILILPVFSYLFSIYSLYLRSVSLANILMIFCVYFLINKRWVAVFISVLFYSLAHISFFTIIIFAFLCETIRYLCVKEFFPRNIYAAVMGSLSGCFIHPDYPNNLLSLYLNGFLVPLYSLSNTAGIDLGRELSSSPARAIFLGNFAVFFNINLTFWLIAFSKIRMSFSTLVWWACTSAYLVLSFLSNRYWPQANILFFIFFASFIKDWGIENGGNKRAKIINISLAVYFAIIFAVSFSSLKDLKNSLAEKISYSINYENTGAWMCRNIPAGNTIYHAAWGDSPFFLCLNPKNDYLVLLDPIYMYYRNPQLYFLYRDLGVGKNNVPVYYSLKEIFKVRYGFVNKKLELSRHIRDDASHFKILYENNAGIVFEVLPRALRAVPGNKT